MNRKPTYKELEQRIKDLEAKLAEPGGARSGPGMPVEMQTALLDNIPGCIALILRKDTHEIVASNKLAREIGAIPGRTCYESCAGRDEYCTFCLAPELSKTGQPQSLEVEYRGKWYEGIWVPFTDELYVHYIFDITERKNAERDLKNNQELMMIAQEIANVGSWTWNINTNDLQWSDQFYKILGFQPGEKVPSPELYRSLIHPDDIALESEALRLALETPDKPYEVEHRIIIGKGEERIVASKGKVVSRGRDGSPLFMAGTTQDITELRQAEQQLREMESHQRALIDAVPDSLFLMNPDGTNVLVNAGLARNFGRPVNELTGMNTLNLVPDEVASGRRQAIERLLRTGEPVTFEDNRFGRYMENRIFPVKDSLGRITHIAVFGRDVTERIEAAADLEKTSKFLTEAQAAANLGCWEWNPENNSVFWSDEVFKILGMTPGEIPADFDLWFNMIHPDDTEVINEFIKQVQQGAGVFELEYRIILSDNSIRYLLVKGKRQSTGTEKTSLVSGIVLDVTERKQVELELKKHKENLEKMVLDRTGELTALVNAMSGREIRMAELKKIIEKLRQQLLDAGLIPAANDPLKLP